MMTAQPRHHTPRTPGSKTLGGKYAKIAAAMGRKPYEWQQRAADVILELDDYGRLRYRNVYISVPRQCGKTVMAMGLGMLRMMMQEEAKVWYTAQTGQAARERWLKECATPVSNRLGPLAEVRKGAGDTRMWLPHNFSEFRPMPPNAEYLHGEQSDLVMADEAWIHDDASGAALMQAVTPTFQSRAGTKLGVQMVKLSTMGTADSTWWHQGLAEAIAGQPNTCVIDYGIPDDVDPDDVDTVIACHPLGHAPAIAEFIREQADNLKGGEFARAFGNRATASRERVIPADAWAAAQSLDPIPDDAPVVFGAAIDIARTETVIAACAVVDDTPMIEVVDRRPGTSWAAARLEALTIDHGAPPPVVDPVGPSGTLHDELVGRGMDIPSFTVRDLTRASANFMDRLTHTDNGILAPTVRIRPDDGLDAAIEAVATRKVGDAWSWQRTPDGSIASLEAATLALHAAAHKPTPAVTPMILS